MARFLLKSTYTVDGLRGLVKDGGSRRAEDVRQMIESAGGRMESFNFAFGEHDTYVLFDVHDQKTAAALAMAVRTSGALSVQMTALLTPEDVDGVVGESINYRPPGA